MSIKFRTPEQITLLAVPAAPAVDTGTIKLYARTVSGKTELYVRNATGTESQVTDNGTAIAGSLRTASGTVSVSASTAPTAGQALVATSDTTAVWQNVSSLQLASSLPVDVDAASALLGNATTAAKADHKHSIRVASPVPLTVGGNSFPGSLNSLARADHVHALPAFGTTAATFCVGNDARLSDARIPVPQPLVLAGWADEGDFTLGIDSIWTAFGSDVELPPTAKSSINRTTTFTIDKTLIATQIHGHRFGIVTTGGMPSSSVYPISTLKVDAASIWRLQDPSDTSGTAVTTLDLPFAGYVEFVFDKDGLGGNGLWRVLRWEDQQWSPARSALISSTINKPEVVAGFQDIDQGAMLYRHPSDPTIVGTLFTISGGDNLNNVNFINNVQMKFGNTATTICQGNDSRLADDRTASGLRVSGGGIVATSNAPVPTGAGQILTTTGTNTATWQTLTSVGVLTVGCLLTTPNTVAYAASISLDTSIKNDFEIGTLTGNITITLTNPGNGRQGFVAVKQDTTGGRTVTISAAGYTTQRDTGTSDLVAAASPNAVTIYGYLMYAIGGSNYLLLSKLQPV